MQFKINPITIPTIQQWTTSSHPIHSIMPPSLYTYYQHASQAPTQYLRPPRTYHHNGLHGPHHNHNQDPQSTVSITTKDPTYESAITYRASCSEFNINLLTIPFITQYQQNTKHNSHPCGTNPTHKPCLIVAPIWVIIGDCLCRSGPPFLLLTLSLMIQNITLHVNTHKSTHMI